MLPRFGTHMLSQHRHSMFFIVGMTSVYFDCWVVKEVEKPESHTVVVFCSIKQLWHAVIWDPLMVYSGFRVACSLPSMEPQLVLAKLFLDWIQPTQILMLIFAICWGKNRPNPFITYVPLLSQWCISTVRLEGYKHRFGARGYLVGGLRCLGSGKGDVFLGWLVMCVLLVIDLLVPYRPIPSVSGFGVGFGCLNTEPHLWT